MTGKGITVGTDWIDSRKNLMLFSGRAHPELADEVAKELDVNVTAQTAGISQTARSSCVSTSRCAAATPSSCSPIRPR